MWNFFARLFGARTRGGERRRDIDSVFSALDEGASKRPLPTLVCRTCGLKYDNTGTYMQGSRCPACHPNG
jgi:predicted Zn-ribbon and HTH transcriptional regulator